MNNKLKRFYDNPSNVASFYGVDKIYHVLKPTKGKISREQVLHYLQSLDAYTLHKQRRLKYPRRNYNVSNI